MTEARRALVDDVDELVRLRMVMLASMAGHELAPGPWQERAAATLTRRLADPNGTMAAFVVDRPDQHGTLAACAVGVIEHRLASPDNPTGEIGYVFNVATDPDHRRRGYSRACMRALLSWYERRGGTRIDLRASEDGAPLYLALGFQPTHGPTLRLDAPSG